MLKLALLAVLIAGCATEADPYAGFPENPLKGGGGGGKADGDWHCPTPFDVAESYDGLVGTFTRAAPIPDPEIASITFGTLETSGETTAVDGDYAVTRGIDPKTTKRGRYAALPMNHALGSVLSLIDDGTPTIDGIPQQSDFYWVMGLLRADGTAVTSLCLLRYAPDATAFVIERVENTL